MSNNVLVIRTKFPQPVNVKNGDILLVTSRILQENPGQGQTVIEADLVDVRVVPDTK